MAPAQRGISRLIVCAVGSTGVPLAPDDIIRLLGRRRGVWLCRRSEVWIMSEAVGSAITLSMVIRYFPPDRIRELRGVHPEEVAR